ncbi:MAG: EamA family transporter [Verrucomicrobiales bacterium]
MPGCGWARYFGGSLLVARGCLARRGCSPTTGRSRGWASEPSSVLCQLYGMFAALFAVPLLGERLRPRQLLWMLLSFGGIVLMQGGLRYESALPVAAGVLAAVLAGGVVVSIRALHRSESTPTIFAAQCAWCVILLAPIAFRGGQSGFSAGMLAGVVAGGLCAAAAQLALTQGFRYLTAASGSAAQMALPAFIGIGGVLLFGETYSLAGGIGVLLALGGAFLAVRRA